MRPPIRAAVKRLLAAAATQLTPDVPAVATLVGALLPLLEALPDRAAALRWHDRWAPLLAGLGRCPRGETLVACADCRAYRSCPLDAWYDHLATAARGKVTVGSTKSFLHDARSIAA